uniref:Uncharacterized protein n=1 Tax=Arundo donax TaxID=35708 RepID=A0A0A9BMQ7_ARUDO
MALVLVQTIFLLMWILLNIFRYRCTSVLEPLQDPSLQVRTFLEDCIDIGLDTFFSEKEKRRKEGRRTEIVLTRRRPVRM